MLCCLKMERYYCMRFCPRLCAWDLLQYTKEGGGICIENNKVKQDKLKWEMTCFIRVQQLCYVL